MSGPAATMPTPARVPRCHRTRSRRPRRPPPGRARPPRMSRRLRIPIRMAGIPVMKKAQRQDAQHEADAPECRPWTQPHSTSRAGAVPTPGKLLASVGAKSNSGSNSGFGRSGEVRGQPMA